MDEDSARTPGVLEDPLLNRGAAFTLAEREALGLTGRLPSGVLTPVQVDPSAATGWPQLAALRQAQAASAQTVTSGAEVFAAAP